MVMSQFFGGPLKRNTDFSGEKITRSSMPAKIYAHVFSIIPGTILQG